MLRHLTGLWEVALKQVHHNKHTHTHAPLSSPGSHVTEREKEGTNSICPMDYGLRITDYGFTMSKPDENADLDQ